VGGIKSEWWAVSNRNGGRYRSESASTYDGTDHAANYGARWARNDQSGASADCGAGDGTVLRICGGSNACQRGHCRDGKNDFFHGFLSLPGSTCAGIVLAP
jgi:hypothetical protein